jgi:hypothetical protein
VCVCVCVCVCVLWRGGMREKDTVCVCVLNKLCLYDK